MYVRIPIRTKANCGVPTLPDIPAIYQDPDGRPEHSRKRRLRSFYFTVLCSYANFRTSYKRLGGINYTIYPGEWVCRIDELTAWFRTRFHWQALAILDQLQEQKLITYTQLGRGHVVKFKIKGWRYFNASLDYNAPCQKDTGLFFLPISKASEIISTEHCSAMDIILDLWMNTIYNDEQVQGSEVGRWSICGTGQAPR